MKILKVTLKNSRAGEENYEAEIFPSFLCVKKIDKSNFN